MSPKIVGCVFVTGLLALPTQASSTECTPFEVNYDLIGCYAAPECRPAKEFPEEFAVFAGGVNDARNDIVARLGNSRECVGYNSLLEGTAAAKQECVVDGAIYGGALLELIEEGTVVASRPRNLPASKFALSEHGPCQ